MSLFNWFIHKKPTPPTGQPDSVNVGHAAVLIPRVPTDRLQTKPFPNSDDQDKTERHERRELIYSVVRDAMIRAGILAASYRFKVLSLDAHGLQYLIMIDVAMPSVVDDACQTKIESQITQSAMMRHNLTVTAVYWRVNAQMTAGVLGPVQLSQKAPERPSVHPHPATTIPLRPIPAYEPLQEGEVAAFKRALASVTPGAPRSMPGHTVMSGRRNPTPPTDFEDTQKVAPQDRNSPLSATQYGDLN